MLNKCLEYSETGAQLEANELVVLFFKVFYSEKSVPDVGCGVFW